MINLNPIVKALHLRGIKRRFCIFLVNHIFCGTRFWSAKRRLLNSIGFQIGENTKVVGPIDCPATLVVGKNCWIGKNLIGNGNGTIQIGDNCDIAPEVSFLTGGHEIGGHDRRAGKGEIYNITVGNGVWIGSRSTILKSVTIGDGSVIAACSCIHKDVEADCLVAGVPAKVVRKLDNVR